MSQQKPDLALKMLRVNLNILYYVLVSKSQISHFPPHCFNYLNKNKEISLFFFL